MAESLTQAAVLEALRRENGVTATATIRELADKDYEYGFVTA